MKDSSTTIEDLVCRVEALERENRDLRARVEGSPKEAPEGPARVSRRALFAKAGAVAAGGLAVAAADGLLARPAEAANGQPLTLGSSSNTATLPTGMAVTQPDAPGIYGLGVTDRGLNAFPYRATIAGHAKDKTRYDAAVMGYSEKDADGVLGFAVNGTGVDGTSNTGTGVVGISGTGGGLTGLNFSRNIAAVSAVALGDGTASGSGITCSSQTGTGIIVRSEAGTGGRIETNSVFGAGLEVEIKNTDSGRGAIEVVNQGFGQALLAHAAKGGAGINATSVEGRGGVFTGKKAPVRLVPSTKTTHPSSGTRGDLFVDKSGRLWFCKGGTNWKQLA